MSKFALLTGAVLLLPNLSFAQDLPNHPSASQCQQIKEAVAQYGYSATRRYALANYGAEAVRFGEQCFVHRIRRPGGHDGAAVVPINDR